MQHQELSLGGAVSAGTVIWDPLVENKLVVFPAPHTDTPAHTPLLYEYLPHLLPPGPFVRVSQQQPMLSEVTPLVQELTSRWAEHNLSFSVWFCVSSLGGGGKPYEPFKKRGI